MCWCDIENINDAFCGLEGCVAPPSCDCNLLECERCAPALWAKRLEQDRRHAFVQAFFKTDNKLTFPRNASPLPKDRLVAGAYYVGVCRNANVARWDGERFHHWREKWGARFVEDINHRDDDHVFDVFDAWMRVAEEEVKPIPVEGLD